MIQERIENCLKGFLQKNIKLQIKEKVLKEGKLILFNVKDFYVIFTLRPVGKNELKKYEIPIPYRVRTKGDDGIFDYRIGSLTKKTGSLFMKIKCLNTNKKSRFYDSVLNIKSD